MVVERISHLDYGSTRTIYSNSPDRKGQTRSIVLDGEREKCLRDCERGEKEEVAEEEEEGRGGRSSFPSHHDNYSSFGRGGNGGGRNSSFLLVVVEGLQKKKEMIKKMKINFVV